MKILEPVIDASFGVLAAYRELAKIIKRKFQGLIGEDEYQKAITKLEDAIMLEDLSIENILIKGKENFLELIEVFAFLDSGDESVITRLKIKIEKRLSSVDYLRQSIDDLSRENFPELANNPYFKRNTKTFVDSITKSSRIEDEVILENKRNLSFFLIERIKQEEDNEKRGVLIERCLDSLFESPDIEVELLKENLNPDISWISIDHFTSDDEKEIAEYCGKRSLFSSQILVGVFSDIYSMNFGVTANDYADVMLIICLTRASMYSLVDEDFENAKKQLESVMKREENKKNIVATNICKEALKSATLDRKRYPRLFINVAKRRKKSVMATNNVYELYKKLIELETRKYNGENIDFEFEELIESMKLALLEESLACEGELNECIKLDPLTGFNVAMELDAADKMVHSRVSSIFNSMIPKIAAKKMGQQLNDDFDDIDFLTRNELAKSTIFFYDDSIKKAPKEIREFLIRKKYGKIFLTPNLESELIESNYQISSYSFVIPNSLGADFLEQTEYDESITMLVINNLTSLLELIIDCDLEKSENIDGLFQSFVVEIKSMLYVLNRENFEDIIKFLESVKEDCMENYFLCGIITSAINEAVWARENYPKLTIN